MNIPVLLRKFPYGSFIRDLSRSLKILFLIADKARCSFVSDSKSRVDSLVIDIQCSPKISGSGIPVCIRNHDGVGMWGAKL